MNGNGTRSAFPDSFAALAAPIDLRRDSVVRLDDPGRLVLVERGGLDLFAVQLDDGRVVGRWTFLCRVSAGTVLLGPLPGTKHGLVGRATPGTRAATLSLDHLGPLSTEDDKAALTVGLERGLIELTQALREQLPPREFVPLAGDGPTRAEPGEAIRSVDGVAWVTVERGAVQKADGPPVRHGPGVEVCLTERDWLVVAEPVLVTSRTTRQMLDEGRLWPTLVQHTLRFHHSVDHRLERRAAVERERLAGRVEADAATMRTSAQAFQTVLRDTEAKVRLADVAADPPALAAARLVASRVGVQVRAPLTPAVGRRMDQIQRILQASRVQGREIRLDGRWWRRDIGPFIGYRMAGGTPVALLPTDAGYVLPLPDEGRVVPVDEAVAKTLRDTGTMLYPPLPDRVRTVRSLLRFGFAAGNRRDLWRLIVTGLLAAVVGLLVPIMTGKVLGNYVARAQDSLVVTGALAVIAGAVVIAAFSMVQNLAALRLEGRTSTRLQAAVWGRLLALPTSFTGRYSTGVLGTMALGISAAQELLSSVVTTATLALCTALANLVLIFVIDLRLGFLALALVLIGAGVSAGAAVLEIRHQRRLYRHEQRLSARVFETLSAVPKIRVAAAEDRAFARWAAEFTRSRGLAIAARRVQNLVTTFNAGFPMLCAVVIFAVVAGPMDPTVPVSTFLIFFTAFNLMMAAVLQFTGLAVTVTGVVPMFHDLGPILRAEPEVSEERADPGDLSGRFSFSHVSFRYGDDGPLVLDDVSFEVRPGEFVAIVGPTGCGKSTILRLLLQFERPTTGAVLYDGQDLAELDVTAVRRQCGVVLQRGSLLAGDIKSNIIGGTNHSVDDAWAAARMAGIDDEIAAMPMGMHTVISDGANTLSGGQRQRIMIARALVSRPRIVFFDEATSALDNPTQEVVARSTHRLNATRLVIAHRLSTIRQADRIIVLDRGRIVQEGTYTDLLADTDGQFARLARHQSAVSLLDRQP